MVHGEVRVPVKLTVMGEHNVMNALAALAVADAYGVPLADAAEKLLEFGGFKNRQQIYHKNDYTIVDDTYNASPDSMKAAIGVLSSLPAGRRIAVLADMKELGENTIQFHREVGAFLAENRSISWLYMENWRRRSPREQRKSNRICISFRLKRTKKKICLTGWMHRSVREMQSCSRVPTV